MSGAPEPGWARKVALAPVISEKSSLGADHDQVTFRVRKGANKREIARAVERLFEGVKVGAVNTARVKGKTKRMRNGAMGRRASWKKAVVTLTKGRIDVLEGLL